MTTTGYPQEAMGLYARWASQSTASWAAHARAVADKLEGECYTPADAACDWSRCVAVAGEALQGLVGMATDAARSCCCPDFGCCPEQPGTRASEEYTTANVATAPRTFARPVTLTSPLTGETLPDSAVSFHPAALKVTDTTFHLAVEPVGITGSAYFGDVTVLPAPGSNDRSEVVSVWVQVP